MSHSNQVKHVGKRAEVSPFLLRTQAGGTLLGVILGLIVGLAIAVGVAIFINRSPTPFTGRDARTDRPAEPIAAPMTDPNKSMYGRSDLPKTPVAERPGASTAAPTQSDLANGDQTSVPPVTGSLAVPPTDAINRAVAAAEANQKNSAADSAAYFLQVGAFRNHTDADATRARLALLGFESDIASATGSDGTPLFRVRIGPFSKVDDLKRVRGDLAANGVDSSVSRSPK